MNAAPPADGDSVPMDDDRLLLQRSHAARPLREGLVLRLMLGLGAAAVLLVALVQLGLEYPPQRHIVLIVIAAALVVADVLRRRGQRHAAMQAVVLGLFAAIAAQTLLAGGMSTPALFALPLVLLAADTLLGTRVAGGLLLMMITLLCALALRGEAELLPPSGPELRALVLGLVLVLMHVFLRVWERGRARDSLALAALNERLEAALRRERAREAESARLTRTLADCRAAYAEALAAQQGMQRLLLATMSPGASAQTGAAPPSEPIDYSDACAFDLRTLVRELVREQAGDLNSASLLVDLEPDVRVRADREVLRSVLRALLQAALNSRPTQLRMRAGLLGLDVIDLELQLRGGRVALATLQDAEAQTLAVLQGTLSAFDDEGEQRWRLLMPRVNLAVRRDSGDSGD